MTDEQRLSRKEIGRLVYNWIGVDGGYLGNFSYGRHDRFWLETCDMEINTSAFSGTTRACFEDTLFAASARNQAAALRALLEEYPPPVEIDPANPKFRSPVLHNEIKSWITRLETGQVGVEMHLESASAVVRRAALDDADTLLRMSGPQSAVDRVHTAMHGYLHSLCDEVGIPHEDRPTLNQLFKALRAKHPSLSDLGTRPKEITRILGAMATIFDALNPVRNNASIAHPNDELIGVAEGMLVINTVRTLLGYLETKRRQVADPAG